MKKLKITDHAVVRYLERLHGLDLEIIKSQMRDDMRKCQSVQGSYVGDKLMYLVSNSRVVTVINGTPRENITYLLSYKKDFNKEEDKKNVKEKLQRIQNYKDKTKNGYRRSA